MPQFAYRELFAGKVGEVFVELHGVPEEGWKTVLERAKAFLMDKLERGEMYWA